PFQKTLAGVEGVAEVSITGDLRRKMETVASADYVVAADDIDLAARQLTDTLQLESTSSTGEEAVLTGRLSEGLAVTVLIVPRAQFGSSLWRTTGSVDHCTAFIERFDTPAPTPDEDRIYATAGIVPIPPELR